MERVIAYKAYDGRLFESEDKCLTHEKKMRQYPKTEEEVTPQLIEGINRVSVSYQKSPKSTILRDSYFIVQDKIKITGFGDCVPTLDIHNTNMKLASEMEIIAAIMINEAGGVDDFIVREIISKFNENTKGKIELRLDTDFKTYWVIEDMRWRWGMYAPMGRYVKIERLD